MAPLLPSELLQVVPQLKVSRLLKARSFTSTISTESFDAALSANAILSLGFHQEDI